LYIAVGVGGKAHPFVELYAALCYGGGGHLYLQHYLSHVQQKVFHYPLAHTLVAVLFGNGKVLDVCKFVENQ
jgi:hypothetical protein